MIGAVLAWARGLRFRGLFFLTLGLLVIDLMVPDPLPFLDELVLGLAALTLGALRRPEGPSSPPR